MHKIGIDAYPLSRKLTGIGYYLLPLLQTLVAEHPNASFYLYAPCVSDTLKKFSPYPNVHLRIVPYLSFSEALWSQSTLPFFLFKDKVDLLWSATQSLPFLLPRRVKTVLSVHDFAYRLFPTTVALVRGLYLRQAASFFYRKADCLVANSQATAKKLKQLYQRKADAVIYPPLSLPLVQAFPKEHLITVATLEPRKNLVALLQAYEKALAYEELYPWIIVGTPGWKCKQIVAEISRISRKYPHKLHYKGYVSEAEKQQLIASARYLIVCSHYEGYGMPLAEARVLGTAVVAFDQPEMREAAEEDGFFVKTIAEFLPYFRKEGVLPSVGPINYPQTAQSAKLLFQQMEHLLSAV